MKWLLPLLLAGCAAAELGPDESIALRAAYASPYCGASGPTQTIERIRDAGELAEAWRRLTASQRPPPAPPVVDFSARHLVLIALGQRPSAGYAIELAAPHGSLRSRQLSIEISRQQPVAGSFTAQVMTSPCLLVEIDAAADRLDAVLVRESPTAGRAR